MHIIYEGAVIWTINNKSVNPLQVEIPNSLYVTKGHEWLISPQYWELNTTPSGVDATTLDGTRCFTHHDCAILNSDGG